MSYDVEVATHPKPATAALDLADGVTLDGPFAAEPDDLAAPLAAACLDPRWLTTLSAPEAQRAEVRAAGRRLAEAHDGAAYDPQQDLVIWPRARQRRVAPREKADKINLVRLEWLIPASRWPDAPGTMLDAIARRAPEALPRRYGRFEPPQYRFDPAVPEAFVDFVLEEDAFWFAARPSFGGHSRAPYDLAGRLDLTFDGTVLAADERWRETVVALFAAVAAGVGAFYGAAEVEPHWTVSRNNRLSIEARWVRTPPRLGRSDWHGLPPEPRWLAWFGEPYREPVEAALRDAPPPRRRLLRRALAPPTLEPRADGLLVRAAELPQVKLPPLALPGELTWRPRAPAAVIPRLN